MDYHKLSRFVVTTALLCIPPLLLLGYGAKYASLVWKSHVLMHGIFMMLGFITLMGVAVISFKNLPVKSHNNRKMVHGLFNTLCLVSMVIGWTRIVQYKDLNEEEHYLTVHSWLGALTMVLFLLTYLNGAVVFNPYLTCIKVSLRVLLKPYHIASGIGVTLLAAAATTTGLYSYTALYVPTVFKTTQTPALRLILGSALMVGVAFYIVMMALFTKPPIAKKAMSPPAVQVQVAME